MKIVLYISTNIPAVASVHTGAVKIFWDFSYAYQT